MFGSSRRGYAQRFNNRYKRSGHLFGERYRSWVVLNKKHLRAAARYVLLNPVRTGVCERADDRRWSGPHPPSTNIRSMDRLKQNGR